MTGRAGWAVDIAIVVFLIMLFPVGFAAMLSSCRESDNARSEIAVAQLYSGTVVEFRAGDVVRLKSGGAKMVVIDPAPMDRNYAKTHLLCQYEKQVRHGIFSKITTTRVATIHLLKVAVELVEDN